MRTVLVAFVGAVVLALAPSALASSSPTFPDLPGMGGVARLTHAKTPEASASTSGTAAVHNLTKTDRVPAPKVATVAKSSEPAGADVIRKLPGGRMLPVLGSHDASATRGSDGILAALALVVVVLFTRFLVRLNTLGSTNPSRA